VSWRNADKGINIEITCTECNEQLSDGDDVICAKCFEELKKDKEDLESNYKDLERDYYELESKYQELLEKYNAPINRFGRGEYLLEEGKDGEKDSKDET